jgi:hypothetical protein
VDASLIRSVRLGCIVAGAIVAISTAIAGCAALFGLDVPTLACESGGVCPDATAPDARLPALDSADAGEGGSEMEASLPDDDADAASIAADASTGGDASTDAETGPLAVRCGLVDASPPYCATGTVCCAELADGGISFSCTGVCAPADYTITCADSRNCDPLDCCHESGGLFCRSSCPGALVCDPVYRKCPTRTCNVPLSILGQSSTAYLGCN